HGRRPGAAVYRRFPADVVLLAPRNRQVVAGRRARAVRSVKLGPLRVHVGGRDERDDRDRGCPHKWLMTLAVAAAPKPLSMFTTDTPHAQLLSMPRSAAMPPKLAPYPTDVGTAITGTATRPDTTLGSAPS